MDFSSDVTRGFILPDSKAVGEPECWSQYSIGKGAWGEDIYSRRTTTGQVPDFGIRSTALRYIAPYTPLPARDPNCLAPFAKGFSYIKVTSIGVP